MASTQKQTKTQPAALPLYISMCAGAVAGSLETLALYPLDVLKTRAQISTTKTSMYQISKSILGNEGPLTFYRGLASPLFGEGVKRAVKFGSNDFYKSFFKNEKGGLSNLGSAGAGACAGMTEAIFNCPFEVVKVRMQSKENKGIYKSTFDCASQILRGEGIKGLYHGMEAQLWRNVVWNTVYFGIIGTIKNQLPQENATPAQVHLYSLLGGFIGGSLASCCNISFDTAKSRIQAQPPNQPRQFHWAVPTIIHIVKTEGWRAPFRGLGPKVLRLGPGGALMSLIFDKVVEILKPRAKLD